ncbi:hypothetical protein BD770DRAFT_397876 [Pilaira anomala]|nr:hypothetical protein BD770DRAFT_397876 [Pilaira anomala]
MCSIIFKKNQIGLKHYSEPKRQTIEKTYRRVEQENEWAPEGLDLDFSSFDSHVHDRKEMMSDIMDNELPIPQRAFAATETTNKDDTASVEYGPPREIELPYEPEPSCVVDVSNFSDYADVSAYEVVRLLSKDMLEFNSLQDHDVLDALTMQLYQHDEFEFEFESDSELDMTYQEDLQIPFENHLFDVEHFLQCN